MMSFLYNQNHVELCYGLFFSLASSPRVRLLFRQLAMLHCNIPLCKPQINTSLSVLGKPCANSAASICPLLPPLHPPPVHQRRRGCAFAISCSLPSRTGLPIRRPVQVPLRMGIFLLMDSILVGSPDPPFAALHLLRRPVPDRQPDGLVWR